jgi:hypothetical protein
MKNSLFFTLLATFLVLASFFACQEAPKNTPQAPTTTAQPTDKGGAQDAADLVAITDVVHNFYKWYEAFANDDKRRIDYLNSKGKATKLDMPKLAAYHAELMKSGFISKAYIDNDVTYLKKYEAEWTKNKENNNDGPLSGLDFDRVFCGQDWDIKDYTTGAVKADGLSTNQVKVTVKASKIELVKENGKWLIAKIICE